MSGAEFILRKLLFGQRAEAQGSAPGCEGSAGLSRPSMGPAGPSRPSMASGALGLLPVGPSSRPSMASGALGLLPVAPGLLPRGVSGGEDFAQQESET